MKQNRFTKKKTVLPLNAGEELHDLQTHGLFLIQKRKGYCFAQDAVLLSNFVKARKTDIVCDLCAGAGIVSILVQAKKNPKKTYAVEIQRSLSDLARKNIKLNNMENQIEVIEDSVQNFTKNFPTESFNVVTANPPFFKAEDPSCSTDEKAIARQEVKIDFETLAKSAAKLLKFSGKFFLVHQSNRLAEIITVLKEIGLEPKTLQMVQPKATKESNIFLLESVKGGRQGLKVLPVLLVFDEDGNETKKIKKIYCRKK